MGEWGPHSHKHKLNMADFILNMPLRFFARVFGNPVGDPVLLKSRVVTLLRDKSWKFSNVSNFSEMTLSWVPLIEPIIFSNTSLNTVKRLNFSVLSLPPYSFRTRNLAKVTISQEELLKVLPQWSHFVIRLELSWWIFFLTLRALFKMRKFLNGIDVINVRFHILMVFAISF